MQRLRFFSNSDLNNLESILKERVELWIKNWVFTSNFTVSVEESNFESFTEGKATVLSVLGATDQKAFVTESRFDWSQFIFASYLNQCPKDSVMSGVESVVKKNFWSEIFNLDIQEENNVVPVKSSFKNVIKVCISVPDAGVLELVAVSGVLYSLLNKPLPSATKIGLNTRFEAVAEVRIDLSVFMSFGDLSFPDLIEMKVNKSIRSNLDVDNKFYLKMNDRPICYAVLGKVGDVKGVLVKERIND